MATTPKFTSTARYAGVVVSAANTNRDGTGTIVDVMAGVAAGTKIFEVVIQATVTTTAGMIRLYINDGTNSRLFDEITVAAATVSASIPGSRTVRTYDNLVLPSTSHKLQASTHNAESHNVIAFGGDLT
jgi:hypothetical protein